MDGLGLRPDLLLVFATAGHDQAELLRGIREVTGDCPLAGCTGAGVITQTGSDEGSRAVAILAVAGDAVSFHTLSFEGLSQNLDAAAEGLADAITRHSPRLVLLFPDGLTASITDLIRRLEARVSPLPPLFGGAAGEMLGLDRTFQYHGDRVLSDGAVAVLASGAVDAEIVVTHGCSSLGISHVVTRAEGGTVHELDGRPAWEVLKEYLDGDPKGLDADSVPYLCLATSVGSESVVRVPLGLDEATGALFFPGELQQGERVYVAHRDMDGVVAGAMRAAEAVRRRRPGRRPWLVLQADCAGRGQLLFGDQVTPRLIHPVQEVLGRDVPWLGFHSYGEIAPVGGRSCYHNYTMALCAFYET